MTKLNEKQTELMGRLLSRVLIQIRILGWEGNAQQAADLADAFHSLPGHMFSEDFSWSLQRAFATEYQQMYPALKDWSGPCDYVTILDAIERGDDDVIIF